MPVCAGSLARGSQRCTAPRASEPLIVLLVTAQSALCFNRVVSVTTSLPSFNVFVECSYEPKSSCLYQMPSFNVVSL
ncbi:unnamed protein product [Boreogadus saida]